MIKQMWYNIRNWGVLQIFCKIKMLSKEKENGRAGTVSTRKLSRKPKHICHLFCHLELIKGKQGYSLVVEVKASAWNAGDLGSIPGKIPWRRQWPPTPVFLPGGPHEQRTLAGYSPQGRK